MTNTTPLDVLKESFWHICNTLDTVQTAIGGNVDGVDFEEESDMLDGVRLELIEALAKFIPGLSSEHGYPRYSGAAYKLLRTYSDGTPIIESIRVAEGMTADYFPRRNGDRAEFVKRMTEEAVIYEAERVAFEAAHPSPEVDL